MNRQLSVAAAQFLRANAATPVELDILLVLLADQNRWWSAGDMAVTLRIAPELVVRILDRLAVASLLDLKVGSDVLYRFAPVDDVDSVVREIDALRRLDRQAVSRVLEEDV